MTDFVLVIFETGENSKKPDGLVSGLLFKAGIFKSSLCTRLFLLLKSKNVIAGIKSVILSGDTNAWIMKLPFPIERLSCFNSSIIKGFISKFCLGKGATECFMPADAVVDASYAEYRVKHDSAQIIYKAHLPHMLHDIYETNGIRLAALDTVIVAGQDRQELFHFVRRLEPHFRYITVATPKSGDLEAELAAISAESGLTINICNEWKSILKNADLVINLAGASTLSKFRMNSRSLVINYNSEAGSRMQGENPAINGVEFSLPSDVFTILGVDVLQHYSKKELTEVLTELRIGRYSGQIPDDACCAGVLEEFEKYGCRITGYIGRRGIIKTESIIRSVRSQGMPGLG